MGKISVDNTINASPQAVFAYLPDHGKHPAWGRHQNAAQQRGAREGGQELGLPSG